jgi:hypothetical protein
MSWRNVPFVKEAVLLAAAFLFVVPQVLAGDNYHSAHQTIAHPQPAPAPVAYVVPQAALLSVVVTMPIRPPSKPFYVDLRGPDGQVRRFPVEGGRAAIQYRQVVIRSGETLTIHWVAAK